MLSRLHEGPCTPNNTNQRLRDPNWGQACNKQRNGDGEVMEKFSTLISRNQSQGVVHFSLDKPKIDIRTELKKGTRFGILARFWKIGG